MELSTEQPLVTLALFAYNQEDYIESAVKNAFAQTYTNLQIVLSDDHSKDNTFKIMREMVQKYQGPHTILLNRNPKNMGVAAHCNYVFEIAQGEYIFLAAGDDISDERRIEKSMYLWLNTDKQYTAMFSNLEKIDNNGNSLGLMYSSPPRLAQTISDYKAGMPCWVVGASFAFLKSVYSHYGAISADVRQEDGVLAFRAILMGEICYLNEPLVKYRFHDNNASQSDDPAQRIFLQKHAYFMKKACLNDALLHLNEDTKLIKLLRRKCALSYLQRLFFSIPFLGYSYNFMRISARKILK